MAVAVAVIHMPHGPCFCRFRSLPKEAVKIGLGQQARKREQGGFELSRVRPSGTLLGLRSQAMTFKCYCTITCDLREDAPNSSCFTFVSLNPVNKGSGGDITKVEGRFSVSNGSYLLNLTLHTSLGQRKYRGDGKDTDAKGRGALLWVGGSSIDADPVNNNGGSTLKIMVNKSVRCPSGVSPRVFSGISMTLIGIISETQDLPSGMTLESLRSAISPDEQPDSDLPSDPVIDGLVGE
jgi:hypothetical protein